MAALIALLIFVSIFFSTIRLGISPLPSSRKARSAISSLIPEEFSGTIFELGSGWGHLARHLARKLPHANIQAYELSPFPYLFSKIVQLFRPLPNLQISYRNFFQLSFSSADILVCYLYPGGMRRLRRKCDTESTAPVLISNTFALPKTPPKTTLYLDDLYRTPIYYYNL